MGLYKGVFPLMKGIDEYFDEFTVYPSLNFSLFLLSLSILSLSFSRSLSNPTLIPLTQGEFAPCQVET